jgi:hypothetical protein
MEKTTKRTILRFDHPKPFVRFVPLRWRKMYQGHEEIPL